MSDETEPMCKHCGGPISIRNPTGNCDHLYFPDLLTDEAKAANGSLFLLPSARTKRYATILD